MLFNSIEFFIFFLIVTPLFYFLPQRYRWMLLLTASTVFYMFFIPKYIFILLLTILIDYIAGICIEQTDSPKKKKYYLVISILSTCFILFIFKYLGFFNDNLIQLSDAFDFEYTPFMTFILPIGLSFHTFQSLSYVIEVYRGEQKAEKHIGIFALYVMFYPQLVAGPIERPENLLPQLREKKIFRSENISQGLRLILFGLFTKMVIADNIAEFVDEIYADPGKYNSIHILCGLSLYSFQIYCDFFGYSTIAVGCAKAMGFDLTDNFKTPFLSKSIGEFWQRWHISLSSWFRDYLFFPLGGATLPRWILNILIVFIISGIWHGANWTFILWGLAHGVVYILGYLFNRLFKVKSPTNKTIAFIYDLFRILKTFTLVTFMWILFRASNLQQAETVLLSFLENWNVIDNFHMETRLLLFLFLFILMDFMLLHTRFDRWCDKRKPIVRWSLYAVLLFSIIVFSSVDNFPFIYFQF